MTGAGTLLSGAVLGLLFGAGVALVAGQLPWLRSRDLDARIDPYLRRSRSMSLFAAPRSTSLLRMVLENLLGPVAVRVLGVLERLTGGNDQLERRLRLAGRRSSTDSFRVEQVVFGAIGLVLGVVLAVMAIALRGSSPLLGLVIVGFGALTGVLLRDYLLGVEIKRRATRMAREFPTVADLLALAVAAGESPIAAMERVARTSHGALPDEFAATVADIRAGTSVSQALASLGTRTPLDSLAVGRRLIATSAAPLAEARVAQDARGVETELMETAGQGDPDAGPGRLFVLPSIVFAIFPGLAVLEIAL